MYCMLNILIGRITSLVTHIFLRLQGAIKQNKMATQLFCKYIYNQAVKETSQNCKESQENKSYHLIIEWQIKYSCSLHLHRFKAKQLPGFESQQRKPLILIQDKLLSGYKKRKMKAELDWEKKLSASAQAISHPMMLGTHGWWTWWPLKYVELQEDTYAHGLWYADLGGTGESGTTLGLST